jgi:hypothetical protein
VRNRIELLFFLNAILQMMAMATYKQKCANFRISQDEIHIDVYIADRYTSQIIILIFVT